MQVDPKQILDGIRNKKWGWLKGVKRFEAHKHETFKEKFNALEHHHEALDFLKGNDGEEPN